MPPQKQNILKDKNGKIIAEWEGFSIPKEHKKTVRQVVMMGGKLDETWND